MEIVVTRRWKGKNSTLSTIVVDGVAHHFCLEDTDRGFDSAQPDEISKEKIHGRTAIPAGRYQVVITYSNRFRKKLPLLLDVPGFAGIRIHSGNRHVDTEGCLLPGMTYWKDGADYVVGTSRTACERLQSAIGKALADGEEVWVTIENTYSTEGH